MNLIVDIGNSGAKVALVHDNKIISHSRIESLSARALKEMLGGRKIRKAIVSSVRDVPDSVIAFIEKEAGFIHILSYRSNLPFTLGYRTPETLGTDRIAAVAGAFNTFPGSDSLVIDAGTAITYDFLEGSVFTGGNISPGLDTRFRALHHFTGRLPLTSLSDSFNYPGETTTEAIIAGVVSGVVYEINEYIRTFEEKHRDGNVILTGGDSGYLNKKIVGRYTYLPDIVTDGLNFILEYNAK